MRLGLPTTLMGGVFIENASIWKLSWKWIKRKTHTYRIIVWQSTWRSKTQIADACDRSLNEQTNFSARSCSIPFGTFLRNHYSITKSNSLVGGHPGAQHSGGVNRRGIETLTTEDWDYYMQGSRIFIGDKVTGFGICTWSSTGDFRCCLT